MIRKRLDSVRWNNSNRFSNHYCIQRTDKNTFQQNQTNMHMKTIWENEKNKKSNWDGKWTCFKSILSDNRYSVTKRGLRRIENYSLQSLNMAMWINLNQFSQVNQFILNWIDFPIIRKKIKPSTDKGRVQCSAIDRSSRMMAQTTLTRARMYLFGICSHRSPFRGLNPQKTIWGSLGVFKPNSQNRKTCILLKKLLH